jgi:hypothetical protein
VDDREASEQGGDSQHTGDGDSDKKQEHVPSVGETPEPATGDDRTDESDDGQQVKARETTSVSRVGDQCPERDSAGLDAGSTGETGADRAGRNDPRDHRSDTDADQWREGDDGRCQ